MALTHTLLSGLLFRVCYEILRISLCLLEGVAFRDDLLLPSLVAYTVSTSCCRQMLDGAYLDETSERPGRPLEGVIQPSGISRTVSRRHLLERSVS